MALHDLAGKVLNKKTFELYGLPPIEPKPTLVTIASDNPKLIDNWLEEHKPAQLIKVKLGSENDLELISYLRKKTNLKFGIDANGGWTTFQRIDEMIRELAKYHPLFIEQPCPPESDHELDNLKSNEFIPLIADESFQTEDTLSEILNRYQGVNIKLMKCGGINTAVGILKICKDRKAAVLLGCMSESSCGISAAAQISAQAEWVDLDGPILIKNDPFEGLLENYNLKKQDRPGNGVILKFNIFSSAEAFDIF
jgi:L-alanine-DL-glutamate epimerase-like enolase superfamily enzyme